MRLWLALASIAVAAAVVRPGILVQGIRSVDRRGGLFARRGARAYATGAGIFAGLHERAARDAAASLRHGGVVLDVGSGPGTLVARLTALRPDARVIGVEPSKEMRRLALRSGTRSLEGRAEAIPVADASVDLVVSTLSAHHWDDPVAAFRDISRVLASDGIARIYDVRFAGYGLDEARRIAAAAGIDPSRLQRRVLDERLFGLRPYAVIALHS